MFFIGELLGFICLLTKMAGYFLVAVNEKKIRDILIYSHK